MDSLNEREKHILTERRLTDEPKTLEELSQVYDVSRERIRQIEVRAFEKLQAGLIRLAGEQTAASGRRLIAPGSKTGGCGRSLCGWPAVSVWRPRRRAPLHFLPASPTLHDCRAPCRSTQLGAPANPEEGELHAWR